jgi:aspartate racemase
MKIIGLLGGTSWTSTISYYEQLNKLVHSRLGGFHSARILLYSIDYHDIKSSYANDWQTVENLLAREIQFFLEKKPDCLVVCNNTLYKAFDNLNLKLEIPIFHAGKLSADFAESKGCKSVLLLGTKFTMEDGFFAKYFEDSNVDVVIPVLEDRLKIQNLQTQISSGVKNDSFFQDFASILSKHKNVDAVCLACTELPLYINQKNCHLPIINPIDLQCVEAVNFIIS